MKQFLKDSLGWGFLLWLIGYGLGIVFFTIVPPNIIGYILTPIGTILALWILVKKVKGTTLSYYLGLSVIWTAIAVIFDYFFLVKAFNAGNYYKPDVYIYYGLTFLLPLVAGWIKKPKAPKPVV